MIRVKLSFAFISALYLCTSLSAVIRFVLDFFGAPILQLNPHYSSDSNTNNYHSKFCNREEINNISLRMQT